MTEWGTYLVSNRMAAAVLPRVRSGIVFWLLTLLTIINGARPATAQFFCTGECDGDSIVSSSEIVACAQIRAGTRPLSECQACDCDLDGEVSAEEIMHAQDNALNGCPQRDCPPPTPTNTPTVNVLTPSGTPTVPPPTATTGPSATPTQVQPTATATASRTPGTEPTPTVIPGACVGDCDSNGRVLVNELVIGVNIALERAAVQTCAAFDPNQTTTVSVSELVQGVNNLLRGCL